MHMHQPLPRIVVIVYFCILFGHSPVYPCILICVTFIRFSLWLTVKLQIIDYALSFVDWEIVILKPRKEEALMYLHNGICCTLSLAFSTVHVFDFKIEAHTSSPAERCCVGYFTIWAGCSLGCRSHQRRTAIQLNGLSYSCSVYFRVM